MRGPRYFHFLGLVFGFMIFDEREGSKFGINSVKDLVIPFGNKTYIFWIERSS